MIVEVCARRGCWMEIAAALGLLAMTGILVLRGKQGIKGRGARLTMAGVLVPVALAWFCLGGGR